ncbi:tetratricopeptide repeat protein [Marinobacter sp. LN3S78]|uniref:tetratricopeptide repeat protein n=1 Tax=Marinobacter sp. LN3S78 TaxID=3382300 RepID=UPI00387A9CBC
MEDADLSPIQAALDAGDFAGARDRLAALSVAPSAELLELRAQAAYGSGDLEGTLTAYGELYRFHLDGGDTHAAAFAAVMVGMYLMMDTGLMATVRAWLSRAERLVDDAPDSPVWAWLAAVRTYERLMCGDMPGTGQWARRAMDEGHRHGVAPPAIIGQVALARVSIYNGDVDEGLSSLDDVAVELSAGHLDPLTAGQMWCEVICAMQWIGHHDRAEEWTEAMERWRQGAAFGGLNGRCRVHRAEIMRLRGPCDAAEEEALQACEELRPWMRREFGWPLTELGNARLRKGDFAGAEEAFLAAHQNAWLPQPGLALLRLAQGRVDEAASMIDTALEHPFDIPSKERPPSGSLQRAPLLEAQVVIALAAGKDDDARAAATELADIAGKYQSRTFQNSSLAALGRLALSDGRANDAIRLLTEAVMEWAELRMPYDAASLRVVLAAAHRLAGDEQTADMELEAACRTLEDLNAKPWAELARQQEPSISKQASTDTEHGVFRCEGEMRTVTFGGGTVRLKDLKGMRYLERLLAEPGREFHVLDLVAVERGALPSNTTSDAPRMAAQCGLEVFDSKAREAYRQRLAEVEEDIEDAESQNDFRRAELARADREFLVDELRRGVGLNHRARTVGDGVERARTGATRSLRYALDRIARHHPRLGEHLTRTIRTGTYFAYEPDPRAPLKWTT